MSTKTRVSQSGGFTFIEVMIVFAIATGMFSVAIDGFGASYGLVRDTRVKTRAESELRSNLVQVSNVMRAADIHTLSGFDTGGVATRLTFQRVIGADLVGRIKGPSETLEWIAATRAVDGVTEPGAIYLTSNGTSELVARNVSRTGFRFIQQGSTVLIEMTTYWRTKEGLTDVATGVAAVSIRNRE